jgi:hypothetical protein
MSLRFLSPFPTLLHFSTTEGSAMLKTFAGFMPPLLAVLALLSPERAVAGPPEGASGKMVFDEVADGLRKYRKETEWRKRTRWLEKLAPTRDPRVAIALVEAHPAGSTVMVREDLLLMDYFVRGTRFHRGDSMNVDGWWEANEADLRRRAAQLPR